MVEQNCCLFQPDLQFLKGRLVDRTFREFELLMPLLSVRSDGIATSTKQCKYVNMLTDGCQEARKAASRRKTSEHHTIYILLLII